MPLHLVLAFLITSVFKGCVGQSVKQTEGVVSVIQGNPILINCSYELASPYQVSPFWYIQRPGLPPKVFLSHLGDVHLGRDRGFQAKHVQNLKTFDLKKPASQLEDLAVYFCAVSHTVSPSRKGANLKLAIGKERKRCRWVATHSAETGHETLLLLLKTGPQ